MSQNIKNSDRGVGSEASYFNSPRYLDYLERNFPFVELESTRDETCRRPGVEQVLTHVRKLNLPRGAAVLEVGSGLGRILRVLGEDFGFEPFGIDVCEEAVNKSRENLPAISENIVCARAEAIPFGEEKFDLIICWGVFDLTEQEQALQQMMASLKQGGQMLLTGKNDRYFEDDEDASIAEIKSRELGIPNHYTDFGAMTGLIAALGGRIEEARFFLRRGDFAAGKFVEAMPERFLEYYLRVKKTTSSGRASVSIKICDLYSCNWKDAHGTAR